MDYLDKDLNAVKESLRENLFTKLDYDEQENVRCELREIIEGSSKTIDKQLGKDAKGIVAVFDYDDRFSISAKLLNDDSKYRGEIHVSNLLIIAMYEIFYSMSLENIVTDSGQEKLVRKMLLMCAFIWLINHEIAHIYKGHLRLYQSWKDKKELDQHKVDIRTMEWDADCYSATYIAGFVYAISNDIGRTNAERLICAALHGAMYWMRENSDFEDIDKKDHLPYIFREITMIATMFDLTSDRNIGMSLLISYEKEFNKIFKISSKSAEAHYQEMVHKYIYLKEVEDNWEDVKEMLEPFSLVPLEEMQSG